MYMRGRDSPVFGTTGSRTPVREKNDLGEIDNACKNSFIRIVRAWQSVAQTTWMYKKVNET